MNSASSSKAAGDITASPSSASQKKLSWSEHRPSDFLRWSTVRTGSDLECVMILPAQEQMKRRVKLLYQSGLIKRVGDVTFSTIALRNTNRREKKKRTATAILFGVVLNFLFMCAWKVTRNSLSSYYFTLVSARWVIYR